MNTTKNSVRLPVNFFVVGHFADKSRRTQPEKTATHITRRDDSLLPGMFIRNTRGWRKLRHNFTTDL